MIRSCIEREIERCLAFMAVRDYMRVTTWEKQVRPSTHGRVVQRGLFNAGSAHRFGFRILC